MYDVSKFFLVLAFFEALEMTAHIKQWLMLVECVLMVLNFYLDYYVHSS